MEFKSQVYFTIRFKERLQSLPTKKFQKVNVQSDLLTKDNLLLPSLSSPKSILTNQSEVKLSIPHSTQSLSTMPTAT
ncbi:hypothetical protein HCN44_008747 [Aphidius gifuensis]|uniref:Uncharacterized protein n=1 Tax=Aphidius gifuensis TaxID=684658 RepID=A0A834Y3C9_APHGI|nr:hypothetical protein HCN44_008747 [Aphidius gifuensis]